MAAVLERVEQSRSTAKPWRWLVPGAGLLVVATVVELLYVTVPRGNEGSGPVDALVVLGTPADLHGELTQMEQWRTDEAIREFKAGKAPRILFTGGPTTQQYVEADVMAAYAREEGVPEGAILEERRAMTTIQNVANTSAILKRHGWHSIEVVSTSEHLRRAAVLLGKTDLSWRVHVAPTPGRSRVQYAVGYAEEAFGTAVLRLFGTRAEPVLHLLARVQHRAAWCVRWIYYRMHAVPGRR